MGIINSTLQKKKKEKINEIHTLNTSIQHLKHYEKKTNQQIDNMIFQKKRIKEDIEKYQSIFFKHTSMECKICFDNIVDIIVTPCGHCYCQKCSLNMNKCYICQQEINNKHKIYL